MGKDLEKEYLADLDHYDESMGIHSTSYQKCKERLIKFAKYKDLEEQIGCPLDVFVKLTLGQKIWVEVDGMKCYEENHYAEIDTSFDIDEDDWGETEFWAWYNSYLGDYTKASDHVILKLKDYKKTWFLKKDKSE